MVNKQPDALRLAKIFEDHYFCSDTNEAAAELRRLHDLLGKANALARIRHDRVKELEAVNAELLHWMRYIQAQTHIGHIHNTASAAIAKVTGETK